MLKSVVRLALVILLTGALMPTTAGAHATIIETSPTDKQVLANQPREVTLKWSEAVDLGEHVDPAARRHGPGDQDRERPAWTRRSVDGGARTAARPPRRHLRGGLAGRLDGLASRVGRVHVQHRRAPARSSSTPEGSSDATVRTIDTFARGIAFFGLALALGGAVVVFALWPSDTAPRPARNLVWAGVGLLLAGSVVVLLMQGPYASGGSITDAFSTLSFSLDTRFGHALVARIVLDGRVRGAAGARAAASPPRCAASP